MPVLAFKPPQQTLAPLTTYYYVETYWKTRSFKLAKAEPERLYSPMAALRAGQEAAQRANAVRVIYVRGNADADYWEEPVVMARYGHPPE